MPNCRNCCLKTIIAQCQDCFEVLKQKCISTFSFLQCLACLSLFFRCHGTLWGSKFQNATLPRSSIDPLGYWTFQTSILFSKCHIHHVIRKPIEIPLSKKKKKCKYERKQTKQWPSFMYTGTFHRRILNV